MDLARIAERVVPLVSRHTRLAILFGSQVTGRLHPESDIDIAVLPRPGTDLFRLEGELCSALGTDDVDLADLSRASGLLQQIAATRGRMLWQERPGVFGEFAALAERRWEDERRRLPLEIRSIRLRLEKLGRP